MNKKSRDEIYREFLDFIRTDVQGERRAANRRMFNVFLWCFLAPASVSTILFLLVRLGMLPASYSRYFEWVLVVFPITYSLYVLGFEVLHDIPAAFRRGGIANTLGGAVKESAWRFRVMERMEKLGNGEADDWNWVAANFRIDLGNLHSRTRYITVLAGAVFFLIMQGLDALDTAPVQDPLFAKMTFFSLIESSSRLLSQFMGLGIFLVLLYITGSQTYHYLERYLHCAEMMALKRPGRPRN